MTKNVAGKGSGFGRGVGTGSLVVPMQGNTVIKSSLVDQNFNKGCNLLFVVVNTRSDFASGGASGVVSSLYLKGGKKRKKRKNIIKVWSFIRGKEGQTDGKNDITIV